MRFNILFDSGAFGGRGGGSEGFGWLGEREGEIERSRKGELGKRKGI